MSHDLLVQIGLFISLNMKYTDHKKYFKICFSWKYASVQKISSDFYFIVIPQRGSFFDLSLALLFGHKIFKATVHVFLSLISLLKKENELHRNFHI